MKTRGIIYVPFDNDLRLAYEKLTENDKILNRIIQKFNKANFNEYE